MRPVAKVTIDSLQEGSF